MIGELAAHLKSSADARLNLWLGPDRCPGLHDVKGVEFQRSNWTEVSIGHLARENRFPAIVVQYDHPSLVRMLAARNAAATHSPSRGPRCFRRSSHVILPAKLEVTWGEKIITAAGKHPWVIAGVNEPSHADCEVLP